MSLCKGCGVSHINLTEHIYTYVESHEILKKRGLIDSLSLEPFIDPVDLPCGHTFTRTTIAQSLNIKKECPECRKKTTKIQETSRIIREQCEQLEVVCPNNCCKNVERQSLANHLLEKCPIIKYNCTNHHKGNACYYNGVKTELINHMKVCMYRILDCEGKCGVIAVDDKNHNCLSYMYKQLTLVAHFSKKKFEEQELKLNEQELKLKVQELKLNTIDINIFEREKQIKEQYIRFNEYQHIIKEKDDNYTLFKNKLVFQEKQINEIKTEVNIFTKEYNEKKFKLLYENAEKGDIASQLEIAKIYEHGNTKDINLAKYWYKKAQDQDSKIASQCLKLLESDINTNVAADIAAIPLPLSFSVLNKYQTINDSNKKTLHTDNVFDNISSSINKKRKIDDKTEDLDVSKHVFGKNTFNSKSITLNKANYTDSTTFI